MNIVIISDRYAPEARAAAYLSELLAQGLVKRGHAVTVVTRTPSDFLPGGTPQSVAKHEIREGVAIFRSGGLPHSSRNLIVRALDQIVVAVQVIFARLRSERPDVIVVYSPPIAMLLPALIHRFWRRIPFVINLHDLYPRTAVELGVLKNSLLIRFFETFEKVAYSVASQIVVAAPASRRILTEEMAVPLQKVHLVHNYVDTASCVPGPRENVFRARHGLSNKFVVLYAGLMGLAQDLQVIIDCAREMSHNDEVAFVLLGDGALAGKWRSAARDLPNVHFYGPVANEDYYEALRAANVCLVPLSANFKGPAVPGKSQTIMAAGRPLIAIVPEGNDTIELLNRAHCGFALDPGRADQLRNLIELLTADSSLCERLGNNGRAYALEHFNAELAISQFEAIIAVAAAAHPRGAPMLSQRAERKQIALQKTEL